ncbi:hypothetical protein ACFFLM_21205 [Deinococcus oregonensis]|uniref:Uncharacterized protein n=1 Tax=Deinococcus oregonensis TaxID=1805970 RepID=A0ABV6B7W5_9DEIO
MGRPAKYHTPEAKRQAAAVRQKQHRERLKAVTTILPAGAVVLTEQQVSMAFRLLSSHKRMTPPIFPYEKKGLDELLMLLGGTVDVSSL